MRDVTLVQTSEDLDKVLPVNLDRIAITDITEDIDTSSKYCHGMYVFCFTLCIPIPPKEI